MIAWHNWGIRDFTEGLFDRIDDSLMPDNAARDCRNFISKVIGKMEKRKGQVRLNATALPGAIHGMYAYYDGDFRKLITASNGNVYAWDTDGETFELIRSGLDSTAPIHFERAVNYMVGMNGVDAPFKWDGESSTVLANAPEGARSPTLFKEKLFCVPGEDRSALWWSDTFQPEEWPPINYWEVKKGDGDEITCLCKYLGEMIIFKNRSIHSFRGTSLDDFTLDEVEGRVGCVNQQSAVVVDNRIYFISEEGLYTFNGMTARDLHAERIPRLWKNINKEHLHKAAIAVWNGFIWFALPYGESTTNNLVLAYEPKGGQFWPMSGINASCFLHYFDGSKTRLYSGDTSSGYVNEQDIGTEDFGSPVSAYWIGKGFDQGLPEHEKKARKAFIEDAPTQHTVATFEISLDYGDFIACTYRRGNNLLREYRIPSNVKWRYIAPKLTHDAAGICEVRGLMIPVKPKRNPKGRDNPE